MKHLWAVPRPQLVMVPPDSFAFPSGHAFNAALIYITIGLIVAGMCRRRWGRLAIVAAAMGISHRHFF